MLYCQTHNEIKISGRLGNQMMRLMSLIALAKKYQTEYAIPDWKYAKYFKGPINQKELSPQLKLSEPYFHYTPEYWDKFRSDFKRKVVDIYGYLQSYRYWENATDEIKKILSFNPAFLSLVQSKYSEALSSKNVAISIRRGDFVANENYYQIPLLYYKLAMRQFPDHNIILFSDDIKYCKKNFTNCFFCDGEDIEQLALMSLCDNFIISNSTFSFVGAWLANRGKVIRPKKNFAGVLATRNSEKDYWPKEWEIFDPNVISQSV